MIETNFLVAGPLLNRIPDSDLCFSDHKGYVAELYIQRTEPSSGDASTNASPTDADNIGCSSLQLVERRRLLESAVEEVDRGFAKVRKDAVYFTIITLLCAILFLGTFVPFIVSSRLMAYRTLLPVRIGMLVLRAIIAIIFAISLWLSLIMARIERNGLLCARHSISLLLKQYQLSQPEAHNGPCVTEFADSDVSPSHVGSEKLVETA